MDIERGVKRALARFPIIMRRLEESERISTEQGMTPDSTQRALRAIADELSDRYLRSLQHKIDGNERRNFTGIARANWNIGDK